jgi:transcriptional regulator with XRE-family HTH domain
MQVGAAFSYIQHVTGRGKGPKMDETAQQRLARRVKTRRLQLHLSVRAAAMKAGVDRNTWSWLEAGTRVLQDRNYSKVETALEWPLGEILRILAEPAASASEAARQRLANMSREELGTYLLDYAETHEAAEVLELVERIKAIQRGARQPT